MGTPKLSFSLFTNIIPFVEKIQLLKASVGAPVTIGIITTTGVPDMFGTIVWYYRPTDILDESWEY